MAMITSLRRSSAEPVPWCAKYCQLDIDDSVTYVTVKNSADALGIIASNYFGNPSEKIKLVGVTGTNGKTTRRHLAV